MPYQFDPSIVCPECPHGVCIEDRRVNRVRGRSTEFRFKQTVAMTCTFGDFMPGTDNDPDPSRTFDEYLDQFRANALAAGKVLFGSEFNLQGPALAKVEGDVFELMEVGAIWNALVAWNRLMDGHPWPSVVFNVPTGTVPTPSRKAAVLKLPRGYDTTKLFKPEIRGRIQAHEAALKLQGMELGLSSPDIVGIRIPDPMADEFAPFLESLPNLGDGAREIIEATYQGLEGKLEGRSLLFAVAVKRTTRSDRLYQPLFEANVLKYLIEEVLRGSAFRFHVHMGSFEGADVAGRYNAASLVSLMRGGAPQKAVTSTYRAERPRDAAQVILDDLPLFPL
jgi:hypothetical protein